MKTLVRNQSIDTLRGVAILLVMMHHFNIAYSLQHTTLADLFSWPLLHAIVRNGNYGVTIFFVVSGFLITRNALDRWGSLGRIAVTDFCVLRAARILPGLVLLLVVVDALALAGLPVFGNRTDAAVSLWTVNAAGLTLWMNVLITHEGWINYPLGVLWSLSVEGVFYLVFPLLCVSLRGAYARLLPLLALAAICAAPWYRSANQGDAEAYLYGYLACFDAIAIGCCGAVLSARGGANPLRARVVRIGIISAMTALYLAWPISESNVLGTTMMALGTLLLLLGAGTTARPLWLTNMLSACGRRSYELYLLHLVVLGLARSMLPASQVTGNGRLLVLVVYLLLSGVLSITVGRVCLDPANAAIRKRYARAPTVA